MYASRPTFLVILNIHKISQQQQQQVATRGVDINELKGKGVSDFKVVDNYATKKNKPE